MRKVRRVLARKPDPSQQRPRNEASSQRPSPARARAAAEAPRKKEASSGPSGEIVALCLLVAGLLTGLALATHDASDASWGSVVGSPTVHNAVGPFGANLAYFLLQALGFVAFLVPAALVTTALALLFRRRIQAGPMQVLGGIMFLLATSSACSLMLGAGAPTDGTRDYPAGGLIGDLLASGLSAGLGSVGAGIISCAIACASLLLTTRFTLRRAAEGAASGAAKGASVAGHLAVSGASAAWKGLASWKEARDAQRDDDEDDVAEAEAVEPEEVEAPVPPPPRKALRAAATEPPAPLPAAPEPEAPRRVLRLSFGRKKDEAAATPAAPAKAQPAKEEATKAPEPVKPAPPPPQVTRPELKKAPVPIKVPAPIEVVSPREDERAAEEARAAAAKAAARRTLERKGGPAPESAAADKSSDSGFIAPAARDVQAGQDEDPVVPSVGAQATIQRAVKKAHMDTRDFRLPATTLLEEHSEHHRVNEGELLECAQQIVAKCAEFGIGGQVLHIHPGPVVTTFELKPDAGVKYSRICSLEDDLAMALKAETIRIDRIPGKSTVGIEVPNRKREVISFRELVESDVFVNATSKLTVIVGKTIDGAPYVADLAKMPHLLLAGSTGSGKSVALNSFITSILFKATPEEVKMIMVDPKMLELGMYKDIPHLLTPVVTNPRLASNALKWAVKEMETRYASLAGCGVRNIEQYNAWIAKHVKEKGARPANPQGKEYEPLPFIVIVIDELADLMMIAAADVEDSICRLAQMARAVGIHLILATQRPSVDVITGVIKANLPARIAMRVASKVDSRTILDSNGSEQLLGRGDMLFLPAGSSRLMRLHGPYLSETETAKICDQLRAQLTPHYDDQVTVDPNAPSGDEEEGEDSGETDELFETAARIAIERGECSTSYLQRRLKIGYSRAARIVDMMEADGLVSAPDGSKVRKVLVGSDYFAELDRAKSYSGDSEA